MTYGKLKVHRMARLIRTKVKIYPNGMKKLTVYNTPKIVFDSVSTDGLGGKEKELTDIELFELREAERLNKFYQVRTKIKDYCLSNDFNYFWTLTFSDDRNNDSAAYEKLSKWLKKMKRKYGSFQYIFIPERHKDGAIHFHGVTGGFNGVIKDSGVKHKGHIVYNAVDWIYGYTTLSRIRDRDKCASYVTKYVTKDLLNTPVLKGKKKYWCSKGLLLPEVVYSEENLCEGMEYDWSSEDGRVSIFTIKNYGTETG